MSQTDVDVLTIGAGFGGIYQTYLCRQNGLRTLCIDKAHGVGGTWYWNRYPGAMSDTESYIYRFSWDKDDLQAYHWQEHYVKQPEVLKYLEHVVAKYELMENIRLGEDLMSAQWDDRSACWRVETQSVNEDGTPTGGSKKFTTRYLVTALGLLSSANLPDIAGIDTFRGIKVHTGSWPKDLDLAGRRVGVIGSGSTGVQVITALAPKAKRLVCFQRSPQYSVPSGDGPVTPEYRKQVNERYDEIWEQVRQSQVAFGFQESDVSCMSVTPKERRRKFQEAWEKGNGFRFMFWTFNDLTTDRAANVEAQNFIKDKIKETVKDQEKARRLLPREIYARRPLCDGGYYQQFNRDTVDIVNLQDTPIDRMTETGIRTTDGAEYELDAIIFATGFDAIDGSYNRVKIRGLNGKTLQSHWEPTGPTAFLGISCAGFPNMFMVTGPQGPFTNIPPTLETHCEFIADAIKRHKGQVLHVEAQAEKDWSQHCHDLAKDSLFHETASWIFGANKAGKKYATRFYFGGLKAYRELLKEVVDHNYRGYTKRQIDLLQHSSKL